MKVKGENEKERDREQEIKKEGGEGGRKLLQVPPRPFTPSSNILVS